MNDLPKCETNGCTGHLGRFSSCRDESVWEGSLEDYSSFGDVDWDAHYARYDAVDNEAELLDEPDNPRMVEIPTGYYVVQTHTSGMVSVWRYDTEAEREAVLEPLEEAYGKWETEDY